MSKFPAVRSAAFNFDRAKWSDANGLKCQDKSRTVQDQKEDADINTIVRNFGVTGRLPESVRVPTYGDFDSVSDYREAIEVVRQAEASFYEMPSELRNKLDNSPQRFLEWCADPGNRDDMIKYGLAVAPQVPPQPENPA